MLLQRDYTNGLPTRIYRNPAQIKRDIGRISESIKETNEMLNIRSLVTEILNDERLGSPENLIPALLETVNEAEKALTMMRELENELSLLKEELYEVKMRI